MRRFKLLTSRGDTIVEVLIVLAVLGLAFSISAATANSALKQSRSAEEHSQALGILDSQVELMRSAISNQVALPSGVPFCMKDATHWVVTTDSACTQNFYSTVITYNGPANDSDSTGYYDMRVKWEGEGNIGNQQEIFTYRIHQLTQSVSGITLATAPLQIAVNVPVLQQDSPTQPATCNSTTTKTKSVTVTLERQHGAPQSGTTSGNVALFPGLVGNDSYRASVTVPAGYTANCDPNPSSWQYLDPANTSQPITIRLVPQCTAYQTRDYLGYYGDYIATYGDYLGTYGDYLGTYGDPISWYQHTGTDGRSNLQPHDWHFQLPTKQPGYSGNTDNWYRYDSGIAHNSNGYFFEVWQQWYGYGAAYAHYTAAYAHYTAAYDHYTAPYDHYGPYYNKYSCTP